MGEPLRDEELLAAYRAGDEDAASVLFERYYVRLIELIRRQMGWQLVDLDSSADVAQSALQSFFAQLQESQVQVNSGDDLWPLLVTITLNKVRNRVKFWGRQKRDPSRQLRLTEGLDPLEHGPSPEDTAVIKELIERLLGRFSERPRRHRIVQLLLEGFSVSEIASEVGTTERTIYNTRVAAAKILEQLLTPE